MKINIHTYTLLLFCAFAFSGCKDDKCDDSPKTVSVAVKNLDGTPAQLDVIHWIDMATKDTTNFTPTTSGVYILADENSSISGTATYRFEAYKGTFLVASEDYVLTDGECNIEKTSGKSTITLD